MPFTLESGHFGRLVLGSHLGDDLVDAHQASDRLGGTACVAREHDDVKTHGPQRRHGGDRARLDFVGDAEQTGGHAVDGDQHRGLALGCQDFAALW